MRRCVGLVVLPRPSTAYFPGRGGGSGLRSCGPVGRRMEVTDGLVWYLRASADPGRSTASASTHDQPVHGDPGDRAFRVHDRQQGIGGRAGKARAASRLHAGCLQALQRIHPGSRSHHRVPSSEPARSESRVPHRIGRREKRLRRMGHGHHGCGVASQRMRPLRAGMLGATAIVLVSAISGSTVALHLAGPAPPLEYGVKYLIRRAKTQAAVLPVARGDTPKLVTNDPPPMAQRAGPTTDGFASAAASNAVAPIAEPASSSIPDRELTFAWGYAQRHPEAQSRFRQTHVTSAVAMPTRRAATRHLNSKARPGRERQGPAITERGSHIFAQLDSDPHQALAYADPEIAPRLLGPAARKASASGAVYGGHVEDAARKDRGARHGR